MIFQFLEVALLKSWPVRLGVRTSGFHPGNTGSNPVRATISETTFNQGIGPFV